MENITDKSVSAIMIVKDDSNNISRAVDSLINQSHTNWELIIIHNLSEENSKIISNYAKADKRINYKAMCKSSDIYEMYNEAIKMSNGNYMMYLATSCIMNPLKFELQMKYMIDNNINCTYTAYEKIDANGEIYGIEKTKEKLFYKDLLRKHINTDTIMYNVDNLGKTYFEPFDYAVLYQNTLKLAVKSECIYGMPEILCKSTYSEHKFKKLKYKYKIIRKVEKLSLTKSIYYTILTIVDYIIK